MKAKKKKRTNGCIPLFLIIAAVVAISALLLSNTLFAGDSAKSIFDKSMITIDIESGSTTTSIADVLMEKGIIKSKAAFKSISKSEGADGKMKAGTYQFSPSMKPSEIIDILVQGDTYFEGIKVIIPEGYSNNQIIERLVSLGLGEKDAFEDVLKNGKFDYKFMDGLDRSRMLEGFLFPATYSFKKNTGEKEIIGSMLKKFDSVFKDEDYARAKEMGMSVNDVITLASIIEKEAKLDSERKVVSSVFSNRLKINMKLQSCATIQYVLGHPKENLTYDDLKIDSEFNTYENVGLPPSPIASPGEKSIVAALYPAATDYYFFVVTNLGDGSHYFTKTGADHEAAIKKSNDNLNR